MFVLGVALCSSLAAQHPRPAVECPTLDVEVSKPLFAPGETAEFKAVIHPLNPEWQIKYNWHISYGEIVSGQGTPAITVEKPPSGSITVTVEVGGLPDDSICLRTSSESVHWDAAPESEKIGGISGTSVDTTPFLMEGVKARMSQYPGSRLYIFLGFRRGTADHLLTRRETEIFDRLAEGVEKGRITFVRVASDLNVTEFWDVPPGATDPKCDGCKMPVCPSISVTGPAGITQPGQKFVFTGTIEGDVPKGVSYLWEVSGGKIVEGQGTLKISADADWREWGATVTVTLNVLGLPDACPKFASESAGVACQCASILIDEFGRLANGAVRKKIDNFFAELENHLTHQGYIILYGTDREMNARERLIASRINFRRFDRPRITIVRGGVHPNGSVYTKLYRVPPGAENPAP